MSVLRSSAPQIFGIFSGSVFPAATSFQFCQLNFVRYRRVERRNKTPIKPKHEKHIPFEPKYIPAKFRVAPPRHTQFEYKPEVNKGIEQATWSSGDRSHPLPDDPVEETYPQKLPDGGIRYYGFTYYPRDPENLETLPQEEISPLFMIRMVKCGFPIEKYLKVILNELGFVPKYKTGQVLIVKNVPEVNEKLYLIKHLIEIKPVKLPPNLPLDADPKHCRFTEDAELLYSPDYELTPDQLEEPEDLVAVKQHTTLINEEARRRWNRAWDKKFI